MAATNQPSLGNRPIGEAIAELARLHSKDTPERFQERVRQAFRWQLTKTEADAIIRDALQRP